MEDKRNTQLWEQNRALMDGLLIRSGATESIIADVHVLVDDTDYFYAPASTKYHGARPGGLFDHSYSVANMLLEWTETGVINWYRRVSPVLVGLLHDFTKVGKYREVGYLGNGGPVYDYFPARERIDYGGHGSDSCIKVGKVINLNDEEMACIRWHMGAYEGKEIWPLFDAAIRSYPNVMWTHHADMLVSKVLDV